MMNKNIAMKKKTKNKKKKEMKKKNIIIIINEIRWKEINNNPMQINIRICYREQ